MTAAHRVLVRLVLVSLSLVLPASVTWAQQSSHALTIGATIGKATWLRVSSSTLEVAPVAGGSPTVVGTIEFQAGARTRRDGEVVLTVEALRDIDTLAGGPAGGTVVIDFTGSDEGIVPGVLSVSPQIAGRWAGSGSRRGRLTFTVRGSGDLTGGVIPLRFVLSTP